jgi:hypothetical protein
MSHSDRLASNVVRGLSLGAMANFGSGNISLWSAGNSTITYATSYAGCSSGTDGYALRIAVEKMQ